MGAGLPLADIARSRPANLEPGGECRSSQPFALFAGERSYLIM
jgi:hypothetical protein